MPGTALSLPKSHLMTRHANPETQDLCYTHLMDEETEAQWGQVTAGNGRTLV